MIWWNHFSSIIDQDAPWIRWTALYRNFVWTQISQYVKSELSQADSLKFTLVAQTGNLLAGKQRQKLHIILSEFK